MKKFIIFIVALWIITGAHIGNISLTAKFFKKTEFTPYHANYYVLNANKSYWSYIIGSTKVCERYTAKSKNYQTYIAHGIVNNGENCFEDRSVIVHAQWDEIGKNVDKESCMSSKIHVNDTPGFVASPVIGDITAQYDTNTYTCKKHYNAYCVKDLMSFNPFLSRKDCRILHKAVTDNQTIQKDFRRMKNDWGISVSKIDEETFNKQTGKDYKYFLQLGR